MCSKSTADALAQAISVQWKAGERSHRAAHVRTTARELLGRDNIASMHHKRCWQGRRKDTHVHDRRALAADP